MFAKYIRHPEESIAVYHSKKVCIEDVCEKLYRRLLLGPLLLDLFGCDYARFSIKEMGWVSQDGDDRNPCWRSNKIFESSMCFIRLLAISCKQRLAP